MTDRKNEKDASNAKRTEKFGDKTIGRGMDSPDSTEAVLDATTGEPDPRARGDANNANQKSQSDPSNEK